MRCKKCGLKEIKILEKSSGEKIYHCLSCGYNFSKAEISKREPVWFPTLPSFRRREINSKFVQTVSNKIDPDGQRPLLSLLIGVIATFLAATVLIASFNFIITSTLYGYLIFILFGLILFSTVPFYYFYILWNLISRRQGWFNPENSFIWRLLYAIITIFFTISSLIILVICFILANSAVQDLIQGSKQQCLIFVKISDEDANQGSNYPTSLNNNGNYIIFKNQDGEEIKLKDLRIEYTDTQPNTQVCFDYFKNTDRYVLDRIK